MTPEGYFITGTDTGIGKTRVAVGLMRALQQQHLQVLGMKPVSAGCEISPWGLRNDDAMQLLAQGSQALDYERVNPYAFEPPIAPHIAARAANTEIRLEPIVGAFRRVVAQCDRVVVEGVGGWQVPLNDQETTADLAEALGLPVVIVVGVRLGCLNHALLTRDAVAASGLTCAGWVANRLEPPGEVGDANVDALRQRLGCPLLGDIPYSPGAGPEKTASFLHVDGF